MSDEIKWPEARKVDLDRRDREFRARGIDPPPGTTSLSMYLHMGWTIEAVGMDRNVLVRPKA